MRLALAEASSGDIDAAADVVQAVLEDIRRVDSQTIRSDLRLLQSELRRRAATHPPARALLPTVADLLRRPAPVS